MKPALAAAAFALAAAVVPAPAAADPPRPFPLLVEVRAVLPGALENVVELQNQSDVSVQGKVALSAPEYRGSFGRALRAPTAEMPFALGPHATGRLAIVSTAQDRYDLTAVVQLEGGATQEFSPPSSRYYGGGTHTFVDLGGHNVLLGALNDVQVPTASGSRETISASAPSATASGATPLPTTLAGYAGASLVHVESGHLLRLEQNELTALVDWTARGGTIAVSVDDAEHLTDATFVALLGGPTLGTGSAAAAFGEAALVSRQAGAQLDTEVPSSRTTPPLPNTQLSSYQGGNTVHSEFGSVAAYGLGRVVLLPFRAAPRADDPWAIGKLAELTLDASAHGKLQFSDAADRGHLDNRNVKHALDPNQRFRISLGAATALLLAYAGVVAFLLVRDHKQRRLFRPFVWLPVLAASVSVCIVLIGHVSRGSQRGVRRVLLLEGAAGFGLVSVDEYRGYFTSGSDLLTLVSQSPRSLLYSDALQPLHQRDGFSFLRGNPQLPWQTTVTRELRVEQSEQQIAVGETGGVPWVVNRTAATLEDLLLTSSSGTIYLLPKLAPGERAEGGAFLTASQVGPTPGYGLYPLSFTELAPEEGERLQQRYEVLEALVQGRTVHPDGVVSLVAVASGATPFVRGGEAAGEAGLPVTTVATFVHVLGEGGAP